MRNCTLAQMEVQEDVDIAKSSRKRVLSSKNVCWNKRKHVRFLHIFMCVCVCVCIHHTEQAGEMSGETRTSPVPLQKINGQNQPGAPLGEAGLWAEQEQRARGREELMSWSTPNPCYLPAPTSRLLYTHSWCRIRFLRTKWFAYVMLIIHED